MARLSALDRFLPLLFTIVMLFAMQGDAITDKPWEVVLIAVPLPCVSP